MTFRHFSNFCRKKFPGLIQEVSCTYWMNVEVLPHDFCNYNPKNLYKNVQEPRCHTWKLFSADIWKMLEYHFRDDVMLRQSCLQASGASPAQKSRGLRVVYSKNFSRAMLFVSGSLSWLMYIWAIYPRNKFDEKAQCATVIECLWTQKTLKSMLRKYILILWRKILSAQNVEKNSCFVQVWKTISKLTWKCKVW